MSRKIMVAILCSPLAISFGSLLGVQVKGPTSTAPAAAPEKKASAAAVPEKKPAAVPAVEKKPALPEDPEKHTSLGL